MTFHCDMGIRLDPPSGASQFDQHGRDAGKVVSFSPGQPDGSPGEFIVVYAEFRRGDRDAGEPPKVILRLSSRVSSLPDPRHSQPFRI